MRRPEVGICALWTLLRAAAVSIPWWLHEMVLNVMLMLNRLQGHRHAKTQLSNTSACG
jgi:hypothetical protein